jgi:predicted 3-demethylubiquinone-9 3-methyltransferase (glyoxalase superfamily)
MTTTNGGRPPGGRIAPCIWFDDAAEAAATFYTDLFPDARILATSRYPKGFDNPAGKPRGSVVTVEFEIAGVHFTALNGGPHLRPNPSISCILNFDPSRDPKARENLDATWAALSEGGRALMPLDAYPFSPRYGWTTDRFGVSWQLILSDPSGDPRPFVVPSLLFTGAVAGRAEEAIAFYTSVFEDSRTGLVARYGEGQAPDVPGTIMYADFMLDGQWLAAADSAQAHAFAFDEGVSLQVLCDSQAEVDRFWSKLSEGGEEGVCGWLKDGFGVSWQVVPTRLIEMMTAGAADGAGYERAFREMLGMKKLDLGKLESAFSAR